MLIVCGLLSKPATSAQQQNLSRVKNNNASQNLHQLRKDPTRPPSVIVQHLKPELAMKAEYELTAIFTRNNLQYAVVNGNVVKTGDPINDMLVTGISNSNLTMEKAATSTNTSSKDTLILELSGSINVKKQVIK